jgi:hypothetical protein
MSNYILVHADRTTHLKIVAVSLLAGILVIGVGIGAKAPNGNALQAEDNGGAVKSVKIAKPAAWSSREQTIR